jgi:hypothetical protein
VSQKTRQRLVHRSLFIKVRDNVNSSSYRKCGTCQTCASAECQLTTAKSVRELKIHPEKHAVSYQRRKKDLKMKQKSQVEEGKREN